jgi:hypothetical protein
MMWALYLLTFIGLSLLIFLAVSFMPLQPEDCSTFGSREFKSWTALLGIANKEVIERVRTTGQKLRSGRGRAKLEFFPAVLW